MPPTLQQVRERFRAEQDASVKRETTYASSIPAALVTNVPEWDSFLRYLQTKHDEAQASANAWKDRLATAFTEKEQREAQCSYFSCQARAMTIKELMELPQQLMDQTKEAPKAS